MYHEHRRISGCRLSPLVFGGDKRQPEIRLCSQARVSRDMPVWSCVFLKCTRVSRPSDCVIYYMVSNNSFNFSGDDWLNTTNLNVWLKAELCESK